MFLDPQKGGSGQENCSKSGSRFEISIPRTSQRRPFRPKRGPKDGATPGLAGHPVFRNEEEAGSLAGTSGSLHNSATSPFNQRVTHLASRATTHERSKRVHRDKNNKVPMTSRTPRSHSCPSSCLGSSCVPESNRSNSHCYRVIQYLSSRLAVQATTFWLMVSQHTLLALHPLMSAIVLDPWRGTAFESLSKTSVRSGRATSRSQSPAYVVMMAHRELLPARVSAQCFCHRLCCSIHVVAPRFCRELLSCPQKCVSPSHLLSVDKCLPLTARRKAPASSPSRHKTCRAGASGTVSHPFMINQPAKLMMKSRTDSAKPYTAPLHTHTLDASECRTGISPLRYDQIVFDAASYHRLCESRYQFDALRFSTTCCAPRSNNSCFSSGCHRRPRIVQRCVSTYGHVIVDFIACAVFCRFSDK